MANELSHEKEEMGERQGRLKKFFHHSRVAITREPKLCKLKQSGSDSTDHSLFLKQR